jgi:hypothetical protein
LFAGESRFPRAFAFRRRRYRAIAGKWNSSSKDLCLQRRGEFFADYFAAPAASAAASPVDGFFLRRIRISGGEFYLLAANAICRPEKGFHSGLRKFVADVRLFRPRARKNRRKSRTSRGFPLLQRASKEFR